MCRPTAAENRDGVAVQGFLRRDSKCMSVHGGLYATMKRRTRTTRSLPEKVEKSCVPSLAAPRLRSLSRCSRRHTCSLRAHTVAWHTYHHSDGAGRQRSGRPHACARLRRASWRAGVPENRTGAGTVIGNDLVAKSKPDGYTILMAAGALAVNPGMYKKMPYDAARDFAPITEAASVATLDACAYA